MRNELLRYFYENKVGSAPDTEQQKQLTLCTIDYLLDNGLSAEEIFGAIDRSCLTDAMIWMPEDLPNDLWIVNLQKKQNRKTGEWYEQQDNLIERDTFYYHPRLRIVSKPPYINRRGQEITEPFFCEPVMRFTIDDCLQYFYKTKEIDNDIILQDSTQSLRLRNLYRQVQNSISFISAADVILFLIDMNNNAYAINVLNDELSYDVVSYLKCIIANAHAEGKDKIIWRHQRWLG